MLQQEQPDDYAIATGSHKLEDFVACVGLDWREHVIDASLLRPTDIAFSRGNPAKARERLRWQAQQDGRCGANGGS